MATPTVEFGPPFRDGVLRQSRVTVESILEERWIRQGIILNPEDWPAQAQFLYTWTLDPARNIVVYVEAISSPGETPQPRLTQEMTLAACQEQFRHALDEEWAKLHLEEAKVDSKAPLWERAILQTRLRLWTERFIYPLASALDRSLHYTWEA